MNILGYLSSWKINLLCVGFAVVGLLLGGTAGAQDTAPNRRPNVVVFLVDDMGVMDTSVPFLTGDSGQPQRYPLNDYYQTPNMQRLANQGIRFSNFYAMSVCSPSRISILTGQNAARHHTTQWISPEENNRGEFGPLDWNWEGINRRTVTLPRLLSAAGYQTIHVGKGHLGPFGSEGDDPVNAGFDVNIAGRAIGAPGSYFGKDNFGNRKKQKARKDRAVPHLQKYHGTDTHLTDALTQEALAQIEVSVAADRPFFLHLAHYAVHSPHQSDPRFAARYTSSGKSKKAQAFATLVEGMDQSLGDLLTGLDELGVAENTLILFLGDNGSDGPLGHEHAVACAAPLRGKKGSHYEGGVRVPFIAAWAKPNLNLPIQRSLAIPEDKIQPQMANVCDLLPTICQLTQTKVPDEHTVDGQSLATLLSGRADPDHSQQFLMHFPHSPHRSEYYTTLRSGDWKIAYHYYPGEDSGGERYQLFNLATDPFEQNDVARANPATLQKLVLQMAKQLDTYEAQYVVDKDDPNNVLKPQATP